MLVICPANILQTTFFKPEFNSFEAAINQFDNSTNRLSRSQYTKQISEQKYRLNASRTGLFKKVEAELSSSHDDFVQAAITLKIIVDKFRNISHLSPEDIIGKTEGIIALFEDEEYKSSVTLLSLTDRIAQLKAINNEAKQTLAKKLIETGRRNMIRKTEITRRELNLAYDALVDQLNFIARRDGYDDYQSLFAFWNALIDKARISISARRNKNKGGKTDAGTSNPPVPPAGGGDDDDRPVIE